MSENDKTYEKFASSMMSMGYYFDSRKYDAIVNYLGPNVHKADASLVACSDENELNYIKKSFLIEKLGLSEDDPRLEDTIKQVCNIMGESNRHKHRTTFYYLLMAILEVEYTALT